MVYLKKKKERKYIEEEHRIMAIT